MTDYNREDPARVAQLREINELLKRMGLIPDDQSGNQVAGTGGAQGSGPRTGAGNGTGAGRRASAANQTASANQGEDFRALLEKLQRLGPEGIKQMLRQNPQLAQMVMRAAA